MFDLAKAENLLNILLLKHEELVFDAQGFGLRMAAVPRGLMSVKEAQGIVADIGKNAEKLQKFYHSLLDTPDVPVDMKDAFNKLLLTAREAVEKCEADRKRALDALVAHEDLLVGEAFQEMFQAVRLAVLDFDVADDVDLDFKTTLHLDQDPSYAVGTIYVKKGAAPVYTVAVGYRAVDEFFYGNITADKRYKTFREVVKKNGRTKLVAFVRELTEQLKALADADAAGVFMSRKKVELTLFDPHEVQAALRSRIEEQLKRLWRIDQPPSPNIVLSVAGTTGTGTATWYGNGWGWNDKLDNLTSAESKVDYFESKRPNFNTSFDVTLSNGQVWQVECKAQPWYYLTRMRDLRGYKDFHFTTTKELRDNWPPEYSSKPALPDLRARAQAAGISYDPKSRSLNNLIQALQTKFSPPEGLHLQTAEVSLSLTRKNAKKSSATRVADAYLAVRVAGASSFGVYQPGKDDRQAFSNAVANARHSHGHDGYSGTIAEKSSYTVRRKEPFTWNGQWPMPSDMRQFIERDSDSNACYDKWGPACAVPISEEKVLAKDTVTVTVEAKDEVEARRKATLLIKATGRVPPKATIVVEVPEGTRGVVLESRGARISTWKVTGLRKQSIVGEVTGWYFYGTASS